MRQIKSVLFQSSDSDSPRDRVTVASYDSDWTPSEPEWQADRQLHYSCGNQGNPG